MRDFSLGLLGGLLGLASFWGALILVLAREGIGPGDSLSPSGWALPLLATAIVVAAFTRGVPQRVLGSGLVWLVVIGVFALPALTRGAPLDQDMGWLVPATLGVHLPAAFLIGVRRLGDGAGEPR